MNIHFFNEDISCSLKHQNALTTWLNNLAVDHDHKVESLNYVFCTDDYLLAINKEYLQHDYFTDIITFDNSEKSHLIEGDVFISIERVEENAQFMGVAFQQELHRVIVHGLLHLLGFADKTDVEKKQMREKEEACLSLLKI